jgi:membrane-associated phospholipid phosphatase
MFARYTVLFVGLALQQLAAQAPETPQNERELDLRRSSDPGKEPFLRTFVREEWRMWSSPFRRANYDTGAVKKYIIPFAAIATTLVLTDNHTVEILPNTDDQKAWSGRVSQIGAAYTLAGVSAATYALGKVRGDKHMRETGWLGLEAIAHTQLVVFGMKQITNRRRPILNDARSGFWNGGDSFPSGHAATSFAVASVVGYEYRHHIAVPITAYSLAFLVSASRVSARRHWVSDIFVGGSTGFLIGRHIYKRRHNPELPGSPVDTPRATGLIPDVGFGPRGPALTWSW